MAYPRRTGGRPNSKRLPRHLRNEDIPRDTFTPRTYQVELLESAMTRNTVVCMGSTSGRMFIAVMLMKEMAGQIRKPLDQGGKRTFFILDTDECVQHHAASIQHPVDFPIQSYTDSMGIDKWSKQKWNEQLEQYGALIMTGTMFLQLLNDEVFSMEIINLLILNDCHVILESHPYQHIMSKYTSLPQQQDHIRPRILGLTSNILDGHLKNPKQLADFINSLETALQSVAETSSLVLPDRYGIKPTERVIECPDYEDTTGLNDQLYQMLENSIDFLVECNIEVTEELDNRDPCQIAKAALIECHNILTQLGPWCAACLADMLITQIDKIEKQKEFIPMHKKFLKIASTTLVMVSKVFEEHFKQCEYSLEDLLAYSTPKVAELMKCLQKYRPETDFVIISEDLDPASDNMAGSDSDMSDDSDFSGNEEEEEGAKSPASKQIHIAIKKVSPDSEMATDPFSLEDKCLCGVVFVEHQHEAYALNKYIEEACAWDEGLCFVKSSHLTSSKSFAKKQRLFKKQEDTLRKFRMQELNLLVSTNILEEGVDIPKCNLVVRFDLPKTYKSYSHSKGRARARDAEFTILVEEEHYDEFESEMKTYREIEKVLIRRNTSRLQSVEEVDILEACWDSPIQPYLPSPGESNICASMDTAIMLVNRYCAKLPSDAFTHLTPSCTIQEVMSSDTTKYIASLRLPINSPIKNEIQGQAMFSKLRAKQSVAVKMCQILHERGELDCNLMPVGKDMFEVEEDEEVVGEDEDEQHIEARPGTTKRKQYYYKKVCTALRDSVPVPGVPCCLYMISMELTGAITDDQNTRGRKICAPEETSRCFGILTAKTIPLVPTFPVFTRSGEVTVSVDILQSDVTLSAAELDKLNTFHQFLFSNVLRLEKDPMDYLPTDSSMGYLVVPLDVHADNSLLNIDWKFTQKVVDSVTNPVKQPDEDFVFRAEEFEDAVVMPSYRNIDQPQYFYVAEIRSDLNPVSPFPSPELYKTFAEYYASKYGLAISNLEQPLLDVDHTSARLNLLIPRYMNQKGVPLPTSSAETKKARRENLQQKQILVPELCDVHVFLASLWRKAVCLPAILYRLNYLLLGEEIRKHVSTLTKIGIAKLPPGHRFPKLDFGIDTSPENLKLHAESSKGQAEDAGAADSDSDSSTSDSEDNDEEEIDSKKSVDHQEKQADVEEADHNKDKLTCLDDDIKDGNNSKSILDSMVINKDETNGTSETESANDKEDCKTSDVKHISKEDINEIIEDKKDIVNHVENGLIDSLNGESTKEELNDDNPCSCKSISNKPGQESKKSLEGDKQDLVANGDNEVDSINAINENFNNKDSVLDKKIADKIDSNIADKIDSNVSKLELNSCPNNLEKTDMNSHPNDKEHQKKIELETVLGGTDSGLNGHTLNSAVGTDVHCNGSAMVEEADQNNCVSDNEHEHEQSTSIKFEDEKNDPEIEKNGPEIEKNDPDHNVESATQNDCQDDSGESEKPKKARGSDASIETEESISSMSETDVFANMGKFATDADKDTELEEKYPEPLISLDVDMDLSNFIGPSPCEILQAMTMSNANDFFSLERLETIGDSFLKYAITVYLYCSYPGIHEGKLSYLRSKQVSNYNLYRLGKKKGLAECMISTKFEPYENWLPPGYTINEDKRKGPVPKVHVVPASGSKNASGSRRTCMIFETQVAQSVDIAKAAADDGAKSARLLGEPQKFVEQDDAVEKVGAPNCVSQKSETQQSQANEEAQTNEIHTDDSVTSETKVDDEQISEVQIDNEEISEVQINNEEISEVQIDNEEISEVQIDNKEISEVQIDNEEISEVQINNEEISEVQIDNEEISEVQINNEEISEVQIDNEEISEVQIDNEEISEVQIDNEEISEVQIDNEEISEVQINNEEISEVQINNEEISEVQIDNEEISEVQIDNEEMNESQKCEASNCGLIDKFQSEMEEADQIARQKDEEFAKGDHSDSGPNLRAYNLQIHHCLPDKSIADCVESLIGCYLTACDKMAALRFMSWMGLKVLPKKIDKLSRESSIEMLPCPQSPFEGQGHKESSRLLLERLLDGYGELEARIGYTFRDRSYLLQAFTHASYHANIITDCYQRLEFLGDAVLDYVITRHLYEDSDKYSPGVLTDLRSALVNNNIFAALAVKWDFHKYFKAMSPSLFYVIEKFVCRQKSKEDEIDDEDEQTDVDQDKENVELEVPKALGDIFESVAGAVYLDSGMSLDAVWRVFYRIMKPQIDKYLKNIPKSPVRELLEQEPETAKFEKPERTMDGKIRVTVNVVGKGVYTGVGRNYRIAKSAAAKKALRCIKTLEQQGLV